MKDLVFKILRLAFIFILIVTAFYFWGMHVLSMNQESARSMAFVVGGVQSFCVGVTKLMESP